MTIVSTRRLLSAGAHFVVSALLLLTLGTVAGFAQTDESTGDRVYGGVSRVFEVEIPVFVFNRDGESVAGLTADDFEVRDGKVVRPIADFEVYDTELAVPAAPATDPTEPPSLARRRFLLLFDLTFSTPVALEKARRAAREFVLDGLRPDDLAAIATFSVEYGPKLLVTFTEDRAQLARGIDGLGLLRRPGQIDPLRFFIDDPGLTDSTGAGDFSGERSTIRQALEESGFESFRAIGTYMQRGQRAYVVGRIESWAAALSRLARSLDSVRGRKQVILFSEGFDGSLFFGRAPMDQDRDQSAQDRLAGNLWLVDTDESYGNSTLQARVQEMLQEFKRSDSVLHSLDIAGLQVGTAETLDASAVPTGSDDALFFLANETGGTLIEDTNRFGERLNDVLKRSKITYVLSIRPDVEWDGSFHPLKVSLKGREIQGVRSRTLEVSHRSGYYAPRPFQQVPALERNLLAADAIAAAETRDDIGIEVMATPFRSGVEEAYVPVVVQVDGTDILPDNGVGKVDVELFAYASDAEGSMKDFFSQRLELDSADSENPLAQNGFKFYGHMLLPQGDYLLRILVREVGSGLTGVSTNRVVVPDFESDDLQVFPVFYDEPRPWVLAREKPPEGATSVVYPFVVDGEPIVPSARPAMRPGESAGVVLIAYNLPATSPMVGSVVRNQDGEIVARNVLHGVERTVSGIEGVEKLRARFSPDDLQAGVHSLQIEVTDPLTGRASVRSLPFVVDR
ncbi:MAG: VWA domain-containing protein [Thermoanaerobaculia bacterium]|nr:VWA domain-containing protein [Thermoanaerobaculia bacterium]